jgi:hypothetical protein
MRNSKWVFVIASVIILGVFSCKKGDTGPAGPAGPAGAAGATGAAGPDSIITSTWVDLTMTDTTVNGTEAFIQEIAAPAITEDILNNGIVLSYFGFVDGNNVTNVFNASEAANITFTPGNVEIFSGTDWSGFFSFRYVIVPGTMITGNSVKSGPAQGLTKAELQKMNYQDVQKLLSTQAKAQ